MICQHEAADSVVHWNVGAFLRQSNLNARRSPWNESRQLAFPNSEKTLVNISRIDIPLYDIQDGYIAALLARNRRHHSVFRLKKAAHNIQHCGFADGLGLLNTVACKWCIGGHEEMTARGWNQRCNYANKIIVHIAWIAKSRRTS